jgi:pyruvate dehydrogenase (quinone)
VISLSGDGGFTMLMGDSNLPVKVVVFNNGALGFIEIEQKSSGFLDTGTELKNPNFAAMARSSRPARDQARGPWRRRSPMMGRC